MALPATEASTHTSPGESQDVPSPKKPRKQFRIGGKGKAPNDDDSTLGVTTSLAENRAKALSAEPSTSPPRSRVVKEETPVEVDIDETPEQKAERKRAELKRKNEEAAKKQAQQRKKKRF